jgi:hypothetical protein
MFHFSKVERFYVAINTSDCRNNTPLNLITDSRFVPAIINYCMEKYTLKEDVKVYCTAAKSFPDGIQEAFLTLEKLLSKEGRTFYGVSYKSTGCCLIYKAAVSESFDGEAEKYGFESFTISKGEYLTETIIDWRKKIETIGLTFQTLLADPRSDKTSPCVEWYKSDKEVMCMVKLSSS